MDSHEVEQAIAIIGLSGRFPEANSVEQFWHNLCDGKESISTFSPDEISPHLAQNPNYVRAKGILNEIEYFDAKFFGIPPKEAQIIDPQHRLFLVCAWEALENAGYCSEHYSGSIGVFGGAAASSYFLNNLYPNKDLVNTVGDYLLHISNTTDYLPTRVSYKMNLRGPSLNIQTACSTSLVSICVACEYLLNYQCDMAIAGGASISVPQKSGYLYQQGMIFSDDGHCRPFDAKAGGTVPANSVGVIVLKRLEDALDDGDHIYAVIRGYGINNDGNQKAGFSAPSVQGQADVISSALAMSNIDPETITYAEAHGTGTYLGDPIEIESISHAFRTFTQKKGYCALGSVKGNIGHSVEAAGVAGLIKVTLALQHGKFPPMVNFNKPNPHIDFANSPFYINTELSEWKASDHPRRACVSSFGIGGTNAYMILEEAPEVKSPRSSRQKQLCVLSAKSSTALKTMADNLSQHLKANPNLSLADVAYTLQMGRTTFEHKYAFVCSSLEEAIKQLDANPSLPKSSQKIVFILHDQEATDSEIGRELYETEPCYRYWIDKCAELQKSPASPLFAVEYALVKLWEEWGITPDKIIGYGIGEYVVRALENEISLEEGLKLASSLPLHEKKPPPPPEEGMVIEITLRSAHPEALFTSLGELFCASLTINWEGLHKYEKRLRIPLPTYSFEKEYHWIDPLPLTFEQKNESNAQVPTNIEAVLLSIWKEYLGLEVTSISDDFFEIGGDSLLAIQILAQIEAVFGVSLNINTLIEASTIKQLTTVIENGLNLTKIEFPSNVVKFKNGKCDQPLFLIPPIGGELFCYRHLIDLISHETPIYGIQSNQPSNQIEEIASHYLQTLYQVQKTEPYRLIGFSFGGIIAYEIARQIQQAGKKVGSLIMIDAIRPDYLSEKFGKNDMDLLTLLIELFEREPIPKNLSDQELQNRLIQSLGLGILPLSEQEKIFQNVKSHCHALAHYHPKAYSGNILFIQAQKRFFREKKTSCGETWKNLVDGKIETYDVTGHHLSILNPPNVQEMASLINTYLKQ